jgi:putative PIN family toxin of toxin-antitoxin system
VTHPDLPGVPRLVVDPNVWVSAAITRRPGPADTLLGLATDAEVVLLVSGHLLDELDDVLRRPKFRRYLSLEDAAAFVGALALLSTRVADADVDDRWCRDPDDEYLVALAHEHDATFLVSGDKDLLAVERPGVLVRSPAAAVDALTTRHPWGPALVPGDDVEGRRQAEAEGHGAILLAASTFLAAVADPAAAEVLPALVTPESSAAWTADLAVVRAVLADRGMASRPGRPSPTCAHVALPPDPGRTIRSTGVALLPPDTVVLTLQHRPELETVLGLGGWRVHAVGSPVAPEDLPARG